MAKITEQVDFIGQTVEVGDIVVYSHGASALLKVGKVKNLTPKGVTMYVDLIIAWGPKKGQQNTKSVAISQIIKINEEDAVMMTLRGKI